jgi:hypothetical protein
MALAFCGDTTDAAAFLEVVEALEDFALAAVLDALEEGFLTARFTRIDLRFLRIIGEKHRVRTHPEQTSHAKE